MTASKRADGMARLIIVLFLISTVTALLLGLVNYVTADEIASINLEKQQSAMREVLAADAYEEIEFTGENSSVVQMYRAGNAGYVVRTVSAGSQGNIEMMVGVDTQGAVTGVSIVNMSETSGLGSKAGDAGWRGQFAGGSGGFALDKDGGTIQTITGATITSRAVASGVNAAVDAVKALG